MKIFGFDMKGKSSSIESLKVCPKISFDVSKIPTLKVNVIHKGKLSRDVLPDDYGMKNVHVHVHGEHNNIYM